MASRTRLLFPTLYDEPPLRPKEIKHIQDRLNSADFATYVQRAAAPLVIDAAHAEVDNQGILITPRLSDIDVELPSVRSF